MKHITIIAILVFVCIGCEQTPIQKEAVKMLDSNNGPGLLLDSHWYGTVYLLDTEHPAYGYFVEIVQWRLDPPHGGPWDYTYNLTTSQYKSQEFGPQHMGIYAHAKVIDTKGETHFWSQAYDYWFYGGSHQQDLVCNQTMAPIKYYDPEE